MIFTDYDSLGVQVGRREEALAILGQRCAVSNRKVAALSLAERTNELKLDREDRVLFPAIDAPSLDREFEHRTIEIDRTLERSGPSRSM